MIRLDTVRIIGIFLFVLFTGCIHVPHPPEKELAAALFTGMPSDPSHEFVLTSGNMLVVRRYFHGKKKEKVVLLKENEFKEMHAIYHDLFKELKTVKIDGRVAGGANIRVVLEGNEKDAAVLRNYAARFYKVDSLKALRKKLDMLVPKSFLR